jgi:hypothetical protein
LVADKSSTCQYELLNPWLLPRTSPCLLAKDTSLVKSWWHNRHRCTGRTWPLMPRGQHCERVRTDLAGRAQRRPSRLLFVTGTVSMPLLCIRAIQRTLAPKFLAILPKHIVVFVLIPGCSSFAVFARCLNSSPLIVRSDSFGTTTSTALTVCSRTTGATSEKPVTWIVLVLILMSQ